MNHEAFQPFVYCPGQYRTPSTTALQRIVIATGCDMGGSLYVFGRGSTSANTNCNTRWGTPKLRDLELSDIDITRVCPGNKPASYQIRLIDPHRQALPPYRADEWQSSPWRGADERSFPTETEVDILSFGHETLADEWDSPYGSFASTKVLQPGLPLGKENGYKYLSDKIGSIICFAQRMACLEDTKNTTASGIAALALNWLLIAEPWRWMSLRYYYNDAPMAETYRLQTAYAGLEAVEKMVEQQILLPTDGLINSSTNESVYEFTNLQQTGSRIGVALQTTYRFIDHQLRALVRSHQGVNIRNAFVVARKWRNFVENPYIKRIETIVT